MTVLTLEQVDPYAILGQLLNPYKLKIEKLIRAEISRLGDASLLRDACEYSLLAGGKRLRPALVLMVAEAVGKHHKVGPAALAVEFLHTSSLIADDLPCMDDDEMRRGRPSLHRAYDEETAILASYALIAAAYEQVAKNAVLAPEGGEPLCQRAVEAVSKGMGLQGLTGGQFYDMHPPALTEEILFKTIAWKTAALFETSLALGWIFGGGDLQKLELVKKAAHHLGMAFQMADDLDDLEQDRINQAPMNTVLFLGEEKMMTRFRWEMKELRSSMRQLGLDSKPLVTLVDLFDGIAKVC